MILIEFVMSRDNINENASTNYKKPLKGFKNQSVFRLPSTYYGEKQNFAGTYH